MKRDKINDNLLRAEISMDIARQKLIECRSLVLENDQEKLNDLEQRLESVYNDLNFWRNHR